MNKRLFTIIFCLILSIVVILKLDTIVNYTKKFFISTPKVLIEDKNQYSKSKNYDYLQITDTFIPYNYQDLMNIIYTTLDSGYDTLTFYCPNEYTDCFDDILKLTDKSNIDELSSIGNFVNPFNNFIGLDVSADPAGEIIININKKYSNEDIVKINNKIDEIWKSIVKENMSNEDIIYEFHDYIINNTKYDRLYEDELNKCKEENKDKCDTTYDSARAIGVLFQGYGICSGYTDVMSLVLDRLGITNYQIASSNHVWNALYINDQWKHLDLTWDDPVSLDESVDTLLHKFYLIDTQTLEEFNINNHAFDKSIYVELK